MWPVPMTMQTVVVLVIGAALKIALAAAVPRLAWGVGRGAGVANRRADCPLSRHPSPPA